MLRSAHAPLLVLALIFTAILGGRATSSSAGVAYTVDSTADAVDANPGDGNCATAQSECTLRAAIQEANAMAGFANVFLPAGTFALSIPGVNEDSAATGDLDITDSLHIEGAGMNDTIIDGGGIDRVFHNLAVAEILDLTIQHGNADDPSFGEGAGIYNVGGVLELLRTRITLNTARVIGGGISSRGDGVSTSIRESVIDSNTSEDSAAIDSSGTLSIVASTISNNTATRFTGGIVANAASLVMLNSTVSGNVGAVSGGGIQLFGGADGEIANSTIVDNEGGSTGGLRVTGASVLEIANSLVANNSGDNCFADESNQSSIVDEGHNQSSDSSCGFASNGGADNVNPLIGPLADNGGLTRTHALLQGSPAIDAGDNSLCPDEDQRGVQRPQGTLCDVGAYEATGDEPSPSPTPVPTPTGEEVIWGDNNCSGAADPVDALLALRHDAGLSTNTGACPAMGTQLEVTVAALRLWGDIDCSDAVDPVDALKLLRFDAGLSVSQGAGCPELGETVLISEV